MRKWNTKVAWRNGPHLIQASSLVEAANATDALLAVIAANDIPLLAVIRLAAQDVAEERPQ